MHHFYNPEYVLCMHDFHFVCGDEFGFAPGMVGFE